MNRTFNIVVTNLLCLSALIGFVYGLIRFFRPKQALYKKMIACALGCLLIERLYEIVQVLVAGDVSELFQIGMFGNIGCFLFLFSANYGAIDSLMDDRSPELRRYRRLALAAPLASLLAAIVILFSPSHPARKFSCVVEILITGASAYYSLKHLLIPKEYASFMTSLRPFFVLCLLLAVGTITEEIIWCYYVTNEVIWSIPYLLLILVMPVLAPVLERGMKQWKA